MTGTTYSRTDGHAVLPRTWAAVRARGDVPEKDVLPPAYRSDYDAAPPATKAKFVENASRPLTVPPSFLQFALDDNPERLDPYPGEAQTSPFVANGTLQGIAADVAASQLGLAVDRLQDALRTFHGPVRCVQLPAGTVIYRTVGLTVARAEWGAVTNKLLGHYWEPDSPNRYASVSEWRARTAVLAEWNGDYGYIKVTLARPVTALYGQAAMQKIGRSGNGVLPGGADQYFIPALSDNDLTERISVRPLVEVIHETKFRT